MKKLLMGTLLAFVALTVQGQNDYIVKTKGAKKTVAVEETVAEPVTGQEEVHDFLSQYFRYVSMCDWTPGMRFMVIPEKKDMVIKTFAEAGTGVMVSSMSLKHKIMVYSGHDNKAGGLHERVNFHCEDNGKDYYFEVPTASFDDYCYGKSGVPTLAYLGDVDIARQVLMDKMVFTVGDEYYVDTEVDGDGYTVLTDIKPGTEVKIVAIGVGTRSFPVKIIVEDDKERQFFQYVAISRTNSGLRDDEFDISNMRIHSFKGAFELMGDNVMASSAYKDYLGKTVFTLYNTEMINDRRERTKVARLSTFTIKDIKAQRGTDYVKMTLLGHGSGKLYTKEVTFQSKNVAGDINGEHEDYFNNLFASGDPSKMEGVRKANLKDIQKSVVRAGFTENEVKLALGEPTGGGEISNGRYTWVYKNPGKPYVCVYFNSKTKKVTAIEQLIN